MAVRSRVEERGATGTPVWFITWADMMGLLLCFFVMIVAMSEVQGEKFHRALESIQKAFGGNPATTQTGTQSRAGNSLMERLAVIQSQRGDPTRSGGAETVNLRGTEYLCKTVRDGLMITFGTQGPFERGSVVLSEQLRRELDDLSDTVRGLSNHVVIRGNCSVDELDLSGVDVWELSFARARAVGKYLESKDVSERRLRLEARAQVDPVESNLTPGGRAHNRRVEVIVSTELVGSK